MIWCARLTLAPIHMKCIILAGGRGTRMLPLTATTPKPLLTVGGVSLLEHIADLFPTEVDEFIVVIGYLGEQIQSHIGTTLAGRPVSYAMQNDARGTYDALLAARNHLGEGERFFVVYGDDLHDAEAIRKMLDHEHALLVSEVENPSAYGVVVTGENNCVREIQEKPEHPPTNLVSTGVLLLSSHVFDHSPEPGNKGELVLADAVGLMLRDFPVYAVPARFWFPVTTPDDLARLEEHLSKK